MKLITILLIISYQIVLLSLQNSHDFIVIADKINLKIAKALLDEKGYDTSELMQGMRYEQFISKIKYNKDIAGEINKEKSDYIRAYHGINNAEIINKFIIKSLELISNRENSTRVKSLKKKFHLLLGNLSYQKVTKEVPAKNNAEDLDQLLNIDKNKLDVLLWISILFSIIISITSLLLSFHLKNKLKNLSSRFIQLQQGINEQYAKNKQIQILDWEIQRIKNIIINDCELRNIRENYSPQFLNNQSDLINQEVVVAAENTQKPIEKYIEAPERDGYFDERLITPEELPKSLYKIIFYPGSNEFEFDILENKVNIHRSAMDLSNNLLKPACEYGNDPKPSDKKIIKLNSDKGTLLKENDKLKITKKIKIKFG